MNMGWYFNFNLILIEKFRHLYIMHAFGDTNRFVKIWFVLAHLQWFVIKGD